MKKILLKMLISVGNALLAYLAYKLFDFELVVILYIGMIYGEVWGMSNKIDEQL